MKTDRPEQLPLARTEQLIVKEVDDEVLVYDLKTDQAHCLNETAAKVWKNCDGNKTVQEIQVSLASEVSVPVDHDVVWLALDQLAKLKLIECTPTAPGGFAGMSRRQLIRNLGVSAIALPVIISLAAPTAEAQVSCKAKNFSPCTPTTNCCAGVGNCNVPANKCN